MFRELGIALGLLAGVIGLGALFLYCRDRIAQRQGKTIEQVRARFAAVLQFRRTLELCIPGVLIIVLGVFFVFDRIREHESDWWQGLLFIPVGWVLIPLLARKSWRRYQELQRRAENSGQLNTNAGSSPIVPQ
jgi:hypothetical protein